MLQYRSTAEQWTRTWTRRGVQQKGRWGNGHSVDPIAPIPNGAGSGQMERRKLDAVQSPAPCKKPLTLSAVQLRFLSISISTAEFPLSFLPSFLLSSFFLFLPRHDNRARTARPIHTTRTSTTTNKLIFNCVCTFQWARLGPEVVWEGVALLRSERKEVEGAEAIR